jgi:hypothetical protein
MGGFIMTYGELHAKRIFVADKMGLNPVGLQLANDYKAGKLESSSMLTFEKFGNLALDQIIASGRIDESWEIAEKMEVVK